VVDATPVVLRRPPETTITATHPPRGEAGVWARPIEAARNAQLAGRVGPTSATIAHATRDPGGLGGGAAKYFAPLGRNKAPPAKLSERFFYYDVWQTHFFCRTEL